MRVLVAAASKHGGTAEIAEWIGTALTESGVEAVVLAAEDVAGIDGFDAVILGSGVYAGHWLEPGRRLAAALTPLLVDRPVWLFSSGPLGDPLKPEGDPVGVAELLDATGAREHRIFGGRVAREGLGFGEKAVVMALRVGDRDDRPRDEVEAWARSIAASLTAVPRERVPVAVVEPVTIIEPVTAPH